MKRAFTPEALPPNPAIDFNKKLVERLSNASFALGSLDGLSKVPGLEMLLSQYERKEAVFSSQIEGSQSTLNDLLAYEDNDASKVHEDVVEVSNYMTALTYGFERLLKDGFPLSLRLIKEMHGKLLPDGRGSIKTIGEFKHAQNWLGGTSLKNAVFIPTPPHETLPAMGELEKFINDKSHGLPTLIVAGLAHVQFETIHPFVDGNGRLGRMLISLILCEAGLLKEPSLYLSSFFKANRAAYYEKLQGVRLNGDWEAWLDFFLECVEVTATNAVEAATHINEVYKRDRSELTASGKGSHGVLRTHECMFGRIFANAGQIANVSGLSIPTVHTALQTLVEFGILEETTGKQRGKRYLYNEIHSALTLELGDFTFSKRTL
ncbi:MAG: cell filamentation protein Fic [Desulfovibrio sp. S3730MH75]|nr:MAG: cell filamentation protein Fic [Desulfovibrio sp. S3730MH75]